MVTSKKQAAKWSGKWEEMRPIFETLPPRISFTQIVLHWPGYSQGKQQVKITDVVAG